MEQSDDFDPVGRATYSPEDNKLRIYPDAYTRIDSVLGDEYAQFKDAGYKWAAKQECFVCPRWTPQAEDWALRLCGEIGDEDYSPEERSADRAERFDGYRERRIDDATSAASTFDSGPQAFGHQNRDRAERQARRHDRHRRVAVSQWGRAEYWQARTEGVIRHALYRSSAHVRRGRILAIEADQRKHDANMSEYRKRHSAWQQVLTLDDADSTVGDEGIQQAPRAVQLAYTLANRSFSEYAHPRTGRVGSLYSLLMDHANPITAREAAQLWLANAGDPSDANGFPARWARHYELRLAYERAMLAQEGGTAAEADMEPGGWIGEKQIHKVNRSPVTGRVVSVTLKVRGDRWGRSDEGYHMQPFNIERLPEGAYRAPTDEEREAFKKATKAAKAEAKATKPKEPSLVNPTDADAERLQAALNTLGEAKYIAKTPEWERKHRPWVPTPVLRLTQEQYSAMSKGTHASAETRTVHEAGGILSRRSSSMWSSAGAAYDQALGDPACKVRVKFSSGWYNPPHVIVITDKPQKPLPVDWNRIMDAIATKEAASE